MIDTLRTVVGGAARDFRGRFTTSVFLIFVVSALSGATASATPALIGMAIDTVTGAPPSPVPLPGLSGIVARWFGGRGEAFAVSAAVIGTTLSVAFTMLAIRLSASLGARASAALRTAMLRSALSSSAVHREKLGATAKAGPPGAKQPRGTDLVRVAVASTAPVVAEFVVTALTNLPQIVFGLLVLFYDLVMSGAAVAAVGGVVLFVLSRVVSLGATKRVSEAFATMQSTDAALFGKLGETLDHGEELRLLGARAQAVSEFADVADACATSRTAHANALSAAGQVKSAFMALSPLLIVVALQLAHHSDGAPLTIGVVAKLVLLVPLLMARLDGLDSLRIGLHERRPMFDMAARVLSLPASPPRRKELLALDPAKVRGLVRFDDVTFSHDGASRAQLDGVSVTVPEGSIVGICGKSGCGKSTMLRLLLRDRDPDSGAITIDGIDVRDLDPDVLPQIFSVTGQRTTLLNRSLRDNLTLGLEKKPSDERIEEALTIAALDGAFGNGSARSLDYVFRSADANLSGGEIRRLALARMILRDAPVFLLDEPEAALPSADAEALLDRIKAAARGRTCLVVTHAPHLLASSFNVFMQDGKIVAKGTHEELSASCEGYRALLAEAVRVPTTS